jgi:hypothetical protein
MADKEIKAEGFCEAFFSLLIAFLEWKMRERKRESGMSISEQRKSDSE